NTGSSKSLFLDLDHQVGIYNETATLYNNGETQGYNEANEFVDLIEEFEEVQKNMPDGTFYLDIKTCPHIKQPYLCVNGDRESLNFAEGFPFPIVRGLEEFVTDHLGFYLNAKDYTGMTLKTGLLDAFSTVEIQEASIWLALVNCGCVDKKDIPDNNPCLNYLYDPQGKLKKVSYEVKYKYTIQEDEFFRMVPGYTNFTRIKIGEVLAYSDGAKILSDWDGLIFMPL